MARNRASRARWQKFVFGMLVIAVMMPLQFFLRFGEVPAFGWGFTLFLLLLAALIEFGLVIGPRSEYRTPVKPTGGWGDRLGGFWLVACAFTPLLGWLLTSAFTLTAENWRLLYGLRTVLCIGLPFITALPLTRYLEGRPARAGSLILVGVTLLAMLAGLWTYLDLLDGPRPAAVEVAYDGTCRLIEPVERAVPCQEAWGFAPRVIPVEYLPNTGRVLARPPSAQPEISGFWSRYE